MLTLIRLFCACSHDLTETTRAMVKRGSEDLKKLATLQAPLVSFYLGPPRVAKTQAFLMAGELWLANPATYPYVCAAMLATFTSDSLMYAYFDAHVSHVAKVQEVSRENLARFPNVPRRIPACAASQCRATADRGRDSQTRRRRRDTVRIPNTTPAPSATHKYLSSYSPEERPTSPTPSQRQVQALQNQLSPQELAYQESLIQEREAEIREIETGIHELHEIFRDLGTLVQEQGGMLGTFSPLP